MLQEAGFQVQLKHHPEETAWESHGWVKVTHNGQVLASCEDLQHNRKYHQRPQLVADMMQKMPTADSLQGPTAAA